MSLLGTLTLTVELLMEWYSDTGLPLAGVKGVNLLVRYTICPFCFRPRALAFVWQFTQCSRRESAHQYNVTRYRHDMTCGWKKASVIFLNDDSG